jgi:serine/threonine protein kinase/predicted ATPase
MHRPGDTVAGRFRVERIAGSGGMGTVARAIDLSDSDRVVALKTMTATTSSAVERFEREVSVLARLDHPNVIAYIDHGVLPDGSPWLAMEWVDGCTVDELLRKRGMSVGDTVALARGIAAGLGVAHAAGIVHRDIKPANLLLPGNVPGAVKIADFGVARLAALRSITGTGAAIGTPGYMAPEQAQGRRNVDTRSDMFSVGAVLFECLAGRPAFPGDHVVAVLAKVLLEEPPDLRAVRPGVPVELDRLIARLLAKAPIDRPDDGDALLAELDALDLDDTSASERRQPRDAEIVTNTEQRLVSLVLIEEQRAALDETVSAVLDETVSLDGGSDASPDPLFEIADRHRARLERLLDGTALMIFTGPFAATDLAVRAGRAAIEANDLGTGVRVAVATGRAILGQKWPVGEAVEQAAELLALDQVHRSRRVRVDELTAGLITSRFDVEEGEHGFVLGAERERPTTAPPMASPLPCVGRERELGLLSGVFAECAEEVEPRAVLVVAPPGAGKTRLLVELEDRLEDEGARWMLAQADALRTRAPYTVIRDLLLRALGPTNQTIDAARRHLRTDLADLSGAELDRIEIFLTELAFGHPGDQLPELLRSARRDPLLMSDQLRRAVLDWLAALAGDGMLVLVVEDVHWADRTSLELFGQMLEQLDAPILLIATARPEIDESLFEDVGCTRIELGELGRRASERLLRAALTDASDELITTLIDRAGGNPFVLEEMARSTARTGEATAAPTALAMAQARLESLSSPARRMLRAASLFGRTFRVDAVTALVGDLPEIDAALDELIGESVVEEQGPGRLVFRHDLLREAAYGSLPDEDRRAGHRGAGRWLESQPGAPALLIADHLRRGDERVRAAHYYAVAGRSALDRCELGPATECVELGLELAPDPTTHGYLDLLSAEIYLWRGEVDRAASRAGAALTTLEPPAAAWLHAADILFQSAGRLGRVDEVAALLEQVRAHRVACRGSSEWLVTTASGVRELLRSGRYDDANDILPELDEELERAGDIDPQLLAVIAYVRSIAALHANDLVGQLGHIQEALSLYQQAENARLVCAMRGELGFCYGQLGALDRAEDHLTRSLAEAEDLELGHVSAWVLSLLVPLRTELGETERAVSLGRLAVDAFDNQDDERLGGATLAYLALALAEQGDLDAALAEAEQAVDYLEPFPPLLGFGLGVLGRLLLDAGRVNDALEATRRGVDIRAGIGSLEEGDAFLLETHADALASAGLEEEAASVRAGAVALVEQQAAAISDPDLRHAFENGIAVHRRLLGLEASGDE